MNDRQRLEAIVDVVRSYLPPDGISREEAMSQIIGLVDPLPAQPEQEPVARFNWNKAKFEWLTEYSYDKHHMKPLYLAPPSKPWVSLTDEELETVVDTIQYGMDCIIYWDDLQTLIRNIEAALKEKNT